MTRCGNCWKWQFMWSINWNGSFNSVPTSYGIWMREMQFECLKGAFTNSWLWHVLQQACKCCLNYSQACMYCCNLNKEEQVACSLALPSLFSTIGHYYNNILEPLTSLHSWSACWLPSLLSTISHYVLTSWELGTSLKSNMCDSKKACSFPFFESFAASVKVEQCFLYEAIDVFKNWVDRNWNSYYMLFIRETESI